jgi:hypothetical protein
VPQGIVESIAAEHASRRTAEQRVHRPGMSTPPRGIPFEIIEQSRRVDMAGYVMVLEPDVAPVRPRP